MSSSYLDRLLLLSGRNIIHKLQYEEAFSKIGRSTTPKHTLANLFKLHISANLFKLSSTITRKLESHLLRTSIASPYVYRSDSIHSHIAYGIVVWSGCHKAMKAFSF